MQRQMQAGAFGGTAPAGQQQQPVQPAAPGEPVFNDLVTAFQQKNSISNAAGGAPAAGAQAAPAPAPSGPPAGNSGNPFDMFA
mmetsp:Transcript_87639/g.252747  ORF Transcript_87639/g.252747 Transcript_87639/m.252747 type:complete len:83 (+) Transcript_87639:2-250(+)